MNLERAMSADGRFGGHLVTGHIDGIGTIVDIRKEGDSTRLTVEVPALLARLYCQEGLRCHRRNKLDSQRTT